MKIAKAIFSWLLLLACLYYIYTVYDRNAAKLTEYAWTAEHLSILTAGAVLLGAFYLSLAWAWVHMATESNQGYARWQLLFIYARTSIYKYLPGNVFHLLGRNVVGAKSGVCQAQLASATFFEMVLSVLNSFGVAALLLLLSHSRLYPRNLILITCGAYLLLLAIIILIPTRGRLPEGQRSLRKLCATVITPPRGVIVAIPLTILLYAGMAFVAVFIWVQLIGIPLSWAEIGACYVLGWLAGYVVPGAPGGIGVRETFLLFAMSTQAGEADILLFALFMRLVATGADITLFLLGKLLEKAFSARPDASFHAHREDARP
ncbi:hypothetical protein ACR42D_14040 [Desulfovibrio caledoniensis]